jgi:hypothetical protein
VHIHPSCNVNELTAKYKREEIEWSVTSACVTWPLSRLVKLGNEKPTREREKERERESYSIHLCTKCNCKLWRTYISRTSYLEKLIRCRYRSYAYTVVVSERLFSFFVSTSSLSAKKHVTSSLQPSNDVSLWPFINHVARRVNVRNFDNSPTGWDGVFLWALVCVISKRPVSNCTLESS